MRTKAAGGEWWEKHILAVIQHYDYRNESVDYTSVEIYSQHLRDILARVIGYYPGVSFQTKVCFLCIFIYLLDLF